MRDFFSRVGWGLSVAVILAFFWSVKNFAFIQEAGLEPFELVIFLSSLSCSAIVFGLLLWKKRRSGALLVFLLYATASVLLYADLVYHRYYHAIIKLELVAQAGQLGNIKKSILSLMYPSDLWYAADLPLLGISLYFYSKRNGPPYTHWSRKTFIPAGIAGIIIITLVVLKPPYSDQYKVSLAGIIPAHVYDLSWTFYNKIYLKETFLNEKNVKALKQQFKANQEIQKRSPYSGQYKGKNIIMVQAESLNTFPIGMTVEGQEVTPNLNELIETSMYYPNTFLQIGRGNTSDAEFVANNSIYPMGYIGAYKGFPNNDYLSLGNILIEHGYSTHAAHGNIPEFWNREAAYKKQGFQEFYHLRHPNIKDDEIIGMGISDESIFKQMASKYNRQPTPFYSFIVTLTSHRPFVLPEKYQYLTLSKKFYGTATGHYLQSVRYFDEALGTFIAELKKNGQWNDTIFMVYGDHYGPLPKDAPEMKKLLNIVFDEKERFKIPLIIHHPGQTTGVLNESVGSQMDIFPTITALLGINEPLVQFGTTLDAEHEKVAGFAFETTRYTFYSDRYDYIASHKGVFELGTCIDNRKKKEVAVKSCRPMYEQLSKDIHTSSVLLEHNFITYFSGE